MSISPIETKRLRAAIGQPAKNSLDSLMQLSLIRLLLGICGKGASK